MEEKLRILILEDVPADAELVERELRNAEIAFMSPSVPMIVRHLPPDKLPGRVGDMLWK